MTLIRLFLVFCKIGLLGFGGGLAIISMIFQSIQEFGDITASEFTDIIAIAQITPGPVGLNTATYVGYLSSGVIGATVATIGVAVPSFIIVAIVANMVTKYKSSVLVKGGLKGIRPAVVGMISTAFTVVVVPGVMGEDRIASQFLPAVMTGLPVDLIALVIAVVTIVLIGRFKKNPLLVLIAMGCIGAVLGV